MQCFFPERMIEKVREVHLMYPSDSSEKVRFSKSRDFVNFAHWVTVVKVVNGKKLPRVAAMLDILDVIKVQNYPRQILCGRSIQDTQRIHGTPVVINVE
jgi:hypothetical protein